LFDGVGDRDVVREVVAVVHGGGIPGGRCGKPVRQRHRLPLDVGVQNLLTLFCRFGFRRRFAAAAMLSPDVYLSAALGST
jgi:hypothetical protein